MSLDEQRFGVDAVANPSTLNFILYDQNAYGFIATPTDRDWYAAYTDIGSNYSIALFDSSAYTADPAIGASFILRDRFGNFLANSVSTGVGIQSFSGNATDTKFFIDVGSSDPGGYRLRAHNNSSTDDFTNSISAQPGVSYRGSLIYTGDADNFQASLQAGRTYSATYSSPNISDLFADLVDPFGRIVSFGAVQGQTVTFTPVISGVYELAISSNSFLQRGEYTFAFKEAVVAEGLNRFFNTQTGGHFFTISDAEAAQVQATRPDLRREGTGFGGFATDQGVATEEVYRFFNTKTGGHFFTTSEAERDEVLATNLDYRLEGVGFYDFVADQGASTEEVYRFFNTKTGGHFFTASEAERDQVIATNQDYRLEGIAFYAPDDGALI
jgi:hypothetical protein